MREDSVGEVYQVRGGCHCGEIRFNAIVKRSSAGPLVAHACNCSMCQKVGFLHLIVPAAAFTLEKGESELSCYTFNTGVAKHYFCSHCGVKPFYIPRSNPDGYSLNVRCLDEAPADLVIEPFDGQNWEENAAELANLSKTEQ